MNLYHKACNCVVTVTDKKVQVVVAEFGILDGKLIPALYDLSYKRKGKTEFFCSHCEKEVDISDVTVECIKCRKGIPLAENYSAGSDYLTLHEECAKAVVASSVRLNEEQKMNLNIEVLHNPLKLG